MFGEPDAAGERPALQAIAEARCRGGRKCSKRRAWPMPALFDEVARLAEAGADFVALGDFIFADPRGVAIAVADAASRLGLERGGDMSTRHRTSLVAVIGAGLGHAVGGRSEEIAGARTRAQAAAASQSIPTADVAFGAVPARPLSSPPFTEATKRVEARRRSEVHDAAWRALFGAGSASSRTMPRRSNGTISQPIRGDRGAMLSLAMMRLAGRGGPKDRDGAAKLFASAAKSSQPAAGLQSPACFILKGMQFPQDYGRAAEMFRIAAQAGNREAQYALAAMYKARARRPQATRKRRPGCSGGRCSPTISMRRWNMPSRSITALASTRTRRQRRRSCAGRPGARRSDRAEPAGSGFTPPAAACRPTPRKR